MWAKALFFRSSWVVSRGKIRKVPAITRGKLAKMTPKRTDAKPNLFEVPLAQVIDLNHPLVKMAASFDWEGIRREIEPVFCETNGRPAADVRVVVGLLYLKSAFNLSDEQLIDRWVENPYWQWFCGFEVMQHRSPIDPATLSRWRSRIGADRLVVLLRKTIEVATSKKLLPTNDLRAVNVDTTVQPKAIAFPTDSRLNFKMIRTLVRISHKAGLKLRQSYVRVSKIELVKQGRYARARQMRRAAKCQRKLKTYLGRLTRDIERKLGQCVCPKNLENLERHLKLANRILAQTRTSSPKVYSIHEPHVECIAKGKAHKRYEFGNKVSLVVTNRPNWIVGVEALHGNPFDGHTLAAAVDQVKHLTNVTPQHIMVDKGYRGHNYLGTGIVHIAGRIRKGLTRTFRKMLRRRSVIEPTIGHLKSDHRLERNFLKGIIGDQINALMSAIGYNFAKLFRALACTLFLLLRVAQHGPKPIVGQFFQWFLEKIYQLIGPKVA